MILILHHDKFHFSHFHEIFPKIFHFFVAILLKSAELLTCWQFEFDTILGFDDLNTFNKRNNGTIKYLMQVFEKMNLSSFLMKKF